MEKAKEYGSLNRDYTGLCEFKKMSQRIIELPDHSIKFNKDGREYICRPMYNRDIENVCAMFWIGIPECEGTDLDFLHHPLAMREVVGDGEAFMEKDWLIIIIEETASGAICAGGVAKVDRSNMTIHGEMAVVDPHFRGKGIFWNLMGFMDEICSLMGAEYGTAQVPTWNTFPQRVMEEYGWNVCGIFRGGRIMNHGGDDYYRHPTVLIEKFFNDGESVTAIEPDLTLVSGHILKAINSLKR